MKKILVVDDEKTFRDSLVSAIEAADNQFNISSAENGKKAAKLLESESFDLVITDLTMPKLTGIQLTGEIKKIDKSISIILTTGYMNKINPDDCDKLGIRALLIKPFSIQEMSVLIREILDEEE